MNLTCGKDLQTIKKIKEINLASVNIKKMTKN